MSVSQEQLENLKQKIIKAFEGVPFPQGIIALHECEECREVRKTFANKNWKTIEPEILEENFGIIPLFSPEAFHFFLPAFLIYSLEHFSDNDTTCEYTIYAVTPSKETAVKNAIDYWRRKFENFSPEQLNCIYTFLDFVKEDENFEYFFEQADEGKKFLKEFIEPTLKS